MAAVSGLFEEALIGKQNPHIRPRVSTTASLDKSDGFCRHLHYVKERTTARELVRRQIEVSSRGRSLPFDVTVDIKDLLDLIPIAEPYTLLKDAAIQCVAKSAKRMLSEVFNQVEIGGQTPS
ncbi:unnamed protein product [Schistocephalus solidus]|uniref:Uncharacterized protein n=1 Tax=Schistocephalus solidus TaxID=70667 RepID=A0A183S8K0_SCHSO|nr:unnamed protein product [Schistocephalus solidus]